MTNINFMSNDKYSKLIEFVSNKADFFIKPTFSEESDYEIRNILKMAQNSRHNRAGV